jgi:hypothetical protein
MKAAPVFEAFWRAIQSNDRDDSTNQGGDCGCDPEKSKYGVHGVTLPEMERFDHSLRYDKAMSKIGTEFYTVLN